MCFSTLKVMDWMLMWVTMVTEMLINARRAGKPLLVLLLVRVSQPAVFGAVRWAPWRHSDITQYD